jgi:hypothetical protein
MSGSGFPCSCSLNSHMEHAGKELSTDFTLPLVVRVAHYPIPEAKKLKCQESMRVSTAPLSHVSLKLFTTHVCRKAKVAAPMWLSFASCISRACSKLRAALI